MPEISRFFGIIIRMYWPDHAPPHFHAKYGEYEGFYRIEDGTPIQSSLPHKQDRLVQAWAIIHAEELLENWLALQGSNKVIKPIKPLE